MRGGRRVLLLLATALPLLARDDAEDDDAVTSDSDYYEDLRQSHVPLHEQQHHDLAAVMDDDSVMDSGTLLQFGRIDEFHPRLPSMTNSNAIVIPYRPPAGYEPSNFRKYKRKTPNATLVLEETVPTLPSDNNTTAEVIGSNDTVIEDAAVVDPQAPDEIPGTGVVVDFASKSAGALILEKSPNWKGTSNLLNSDKDQYAIIPCQEAAKWVVIGLSEDILVKKVVLANWERYSSHVREFNVQGSQTMGNWADLGTYTAKPSNGKQTFELKEPSWARYLKFRFIGHYGDEHYLTVSQISVHGSTMLQGFHEQWIKEEEEKQLEAEGVAAANETVEDSWDVVDVCTTVPNAICLDDFSWDPIDAWLGASDEFDQLLEKSSSTFCLPSNHSLRKLFGSGVTFETEAAAEDSSEPAQGTGAIVEIEDEADAPSNVGDAANATKAAEVEEIAVSETNEAVPENTNTADPEKPKPTVMERQETDAEHATLKEVGSKLASVLGRLPSASCLGKLDFPAFKSKMLAPAAAHEQGGGMEPIFKKLTDEIRTLQAGVSIHDQFAKESVACYQRVLLDLLLETENMRLEQEQRLHRIEGDMRGGLQLIATLSHLVMSSASMAVYVLRLCAKVPGFLRHVSPERTLKLVVAILSAIVMCGIAGFLRRFRLRYSPSTRVAPVVPAAEPRVEAEPEKLSKTESVPQLAEEDSPRKSGPVDALKQ